MAAKLPRAWFPKTWAGSIALRPVDRWAQRQVASNPYFETWEEARAWMVADAMAKLARATKDVESNRRRLEKAVAMQPPQMKES